MQHQHGPLCISLILNTSNMISTVKSIFFQMRKTPNLQMDANKNVKPSLESAAGKASLHPPDGASSKMLKVVFVSLLLDLIAFAMILPLFPVLLDYYGRKDQVGLSFHSFHHKLGTCVESGPTQFSDCRNSKNVIITSEIKVDYV